MKPKQQRSSGKKKQNRSPAQQTIPASFSQSHRSNSAKYLVSQASHNFLSCHFAKESPREYYLQNKRNHKMESQEFPSHIDSFKSTTLEMPNSCTSRPQQKINYGQLEQQVQEFNNEKKQLIKLLKLQIAQLEQKYLSKCQEVEKLRMEQSIKDQQYNSQLLALQNKERDVVQIIETSRFKESQLTTDNMSLVSKQKEIANKGKLFEQQLKQLESHRQTLLEEELLLDRKRATLQSREKQIDQRDANSQRLQVKINETKKSLDQWQSELTKREQDLFYRESQIKAKEERLNENLSNVKRHHKVLSNVEKNFGEQIKNMRGFDERVFQKLLKKSLANQAQQLTENDNDSLLLK